MNVSYNEDAWEYARKLFCRYGGKNHDAIERDMRKAGWASWSKSNLVNRGKGKRERSGWIERFGYENSLRLHTQKLTEQVNDDEQDLYLGIRDFRKVAHSRALDKNATRDALYLYRDFCKLEIEARRNLDLSRDNLETFVAGYEKLVNWLSDIDQQAAKLLIKHGERLSQMAQAHYGKAETDDGGAIDREDEGGK